MTRNGDWLTSPGVANHLWLSPRRRELLAGLGLDKAVEIGEGRDYLVIRKPPAGGSRAAEYVIA